MEKDLCKGLYTSLFCVIIPTLFPYFLRFWYPYILLHFKCFLLLVKCELGPIPRPFSPQRMSLQCSTNVGEGLVKLSLIPRPFPPPVFHRFQYEIRQGLGREIWSRVMPSGRHMVYTQRAVPNKESRCPVLYCPFNGWTSEHSQGR